MRSPMGWRISQRVFPDLYRATVAAGEQSGHLDTVLERLADYTESREQLRNRTLGAMLYPASCCSWSAR